MFRAGIQKNPLYFKRNKIFLYFLLFFCYNSIRVRGRVCIFPCVFYLHLAFCWMLFFKWRKRLKYEKKTARLTWQFFYYFFSFSAFGVSKISFKSLSSIFTSAFFTSLFWNSFKNCGSCNFC